MKLFLILGNQLFNFKYLNNLWKEKESVDSQKMLIEAIEILGASLIDSLDIPIGQMPLDEQQSKFFKTVYQNPSRNPKQQFVIDPE